MKAEKQEKIAIFGGSFDPPHFGHCDIVKNLERIFDRVIVVPSYISPFKADAEVEDPRVRLNLCKKVFASQKTEVCSREINKKSISYSVDTAAYFSKKYKGARLVWVIGSEEVEKLIGWHDIDRLKTLVEFLVVPRPGYTPSQKAVGELKKRKVRIKNAKFSGLDISSTTIRIDAAFNRPNRYAPDTVRDVMQKHGLFDPYGKYVDLLYKYDLSDKRIAHTYGVAVRGAELAKQYGGSVRDAVVACILHDVAKTVEPEKYAGKVDTSGFPAPTLHAPIGAYIAKRDMGVSDEIAHAIRYHATGCGQMSLLDEIVYLADKTEQGRNYNEVYYFRYLCSVDKDIAMYAALDAVSEYKGILPCEMTADALALYKARLNGRAIPEMPAREHKPREERVTLPVVRAHTELGEVKSKAIRAVPAADKSLREVQSKALRSVDTGESEPSLERDIAYTVAAELDLHKAHDIDIVDLSGKTIIADYFVIASVTSSTAVKALMNYVEDKLTKKYGIDPLRRDVDREWAALDYGGVIVHIFTDKTREFYNIERLWSDGSNIKRFGE